MNHVSSKLQFLFVEKPSKIIIEIIDKLKEQIGEGFTIVNKAKLSGEEAIDELYYRRIGLGISTIVVTLLVIGLYVKLKKVEKKS